MQLAIKAPKDLAAGLFFIAVGIAGYWFVRDMPMGAAVRMGPGYIPKVLSCIVAGLGLIIFVRSFVIQGDPIEGMKLRPLLIITAAILAGDSVTCSASSMISPLLACNAILTPS